MSIERPFWLMVRSVEQRSYEGRGDASNGGIIRPVEGVDAGTGWGERVGSVELCSPVPAGKGRAR